MAEPQTMGEFFEQDFSTMRLDEVRKRRDLASCLLEHSDEFVAIHWLTSFAPGQVKEVLGELVIVADRVLEAA